MPRRGRRKHLVASGFHGPCQPLYHFVPHQIASPASGQSLRPAASHRASTWACGAGDKPLTEHFCNMICSSTDIFDDFYKFDFFQRASRKDVHKNIFRFVGHSDSTEVVYMRCVSEGGGSVGGVLTALLYHSPSLGGPPSRGSRALLPAVDHYVLLVTLHLFTSAITSVQGTTQLFLPT